MTNTAYDRHTLAPLPDLVEMPAVELPVVTTGLEDLTAPLPTDMVDKPDQQVTTGHDASTADGQPSHEAKESLMLQEAQAVCAEPTVGGSRKAGATSTFANAAQHSLPPDAAQDPAQQPADTEQAKIDRMVEALVPQLTDSLSDHTSNVIRDLQLKAHMAGHSSMRFLESVVEEVGRMVEAPSRERYDFILCERLQQLPEYQEFMSQAAAASQHDFGTAQHAGMMGYAANNVYGQTAGTLFGNAMLQYGSFAGIDLHQYAAWTAGLAMTAAHNNGFGYSSTALRDAVNAADAAKMNWEDTMLMPPPPPRPPASRRKPGQPQLSHASMAHTQQVAGSASPGSNVGPASKGVSVLGMKRSAQEQDAGLQKAAKRPAVGLNSGPKVWRTCLDLSDEGLQNAAKPPAVGFNSGPKGGRTCLELSGAAAEGPRQPGMPQSVPHTTGLPQAPSAGPAATAGHTGQTTAVPAGVTGAQQVEVPMMAAGRVSVGTGQAQDMMQQLPVYFRNHRGTILFL
jgi:hypothetical protein